MRNLMYINKVNACRNLFWGGKVIASLAVHSFAVFSMLGMLDHSLHIEAFIKRSSTIYVYSLNGYWKNI